MRGGKEEALPFYERKGDKGWARNEGNRQNKATGQWVIFSTARRKRPKDFRQKVLTRQEIPELDPGCPFCPGNEGMLPPLIFEKRHPGGHGWQSRVAPNKSPALIRTGTTKRYREGIYVAMDGFGSHEVIVESPCHNRLHGASPCPPEGRRVAALF